MTVLSYFCRYGKDGSVGYSQDLWEVATSQHGIFTSVDAEDAGVPGVELRKMVGRGTLERVARGVYRHPRVPADRLTEFAGAVAAMGPGSYLEWDSVLSVNELATVDPPYIHVGLTRPTTRTLPDRVLATRRRPVAAVATASRVAGLAVGPLSMEDVSHHEGVAALTVHRALLDALGRVPTDRIDTAVGDALSRGLLDRRQHAHINWVLVNVQDGLVEVPFQRIEPMEARHGIA